MIHQSMHNIIIKKMGRGRCVADLAGLCGHLSGTSPALGVALPSRPRAMAAMAAMAMEVSGLDGFHAVFSVIYIYICIIKHLLYHSFLKNVGFMMIYAFVFLKKLMVLWCSYAVSMVFRETRSVVSNDGLDEVYAMMTTCSFGLGNGLKLYRCWADFGCFYRKTIEKP